jgi:hypothetical protein
MKREALEMMRVECSVRWPLTERKEDCIKEQAGNFLGGGGENRNKMLFAVKRGEGVTACSYTTFSCP